MALQLFNLYNLVSVLYIPIYSQYKKMWLNKTKINNKLSSIKSPDELVLGLLPPECAQHLGQHLGLSAPHWQQAAAALSQEAQEAVALLQYNTTQQQSGRLHQRNTALTASKSFTNQKRKTNKQKTLKQSILNVTGLFYQCRHHPCWRGSLYIGCNGSSQYTASATSSVSSVHQILWRRYHTDCTGKDAHLKNQKHHNCAAFQQFTGIFLLLFQMAQNNTAVRESHKGSNALCTRVPPVVAD